MKKTPDRLTPTFVRVEPHDGFLETPLNQLKKFESHQNVRGDRTRQEVRIRETEKPGGGTFMAPK